LKRKTPFVDKLADAIARYNGYFMTALEAEQTHKKWPNVPQTLRNPGMLRSWAEIRDGRRFLYPRTKVNGRIFVDFAHESLHEDITDEEHGWTALRVWVQRIVDGRYHHGRPATLMEMCKMAVTDGGADLCRYICERLEMQPDTVLRERQAAEEMTIVGADAEAKRKLGPRGAVRYDGVKPHPCKVGTLKFDQVAEAQTWEEALAKVEEAA
jgi:hypothetical protein